MQLVWNVVYIQCANEFSWRNKLKLVIKQSGFISDDDNDDDDDDDAVVTLKIYVLQEPDSIISCFIDIFNGDFRVRRLCKAGIESRE
jgi:hypothetical protein